VHSCRQGEERSFSLVLYLPIPPAVALRFPKEDTPSPISQFFLPPPLLLFICWGEGGGTSLSVLRTLIPLSNSIESYYLGRERTPLKLHAISTTRFYQATPPPCFEPRSPIPSMGPPSNTNLGRGVVFQVFSNRSLHQPRGRVWHPPNPAGGGGAGVKGGHFFSSIKAPSKVMC
jgi:hypothetical protein